MGQTCIAVHFSHNWPKFSSQMNKNLWACAGLLLSGLAMLTGCASARSKPSAVWPRGPVVGLAPERPLTEAEILARAAAQPPAPVGGGDWRLLFDGRSLAGWRQTPFAGAGPVECRPGLLILWQSDGFTGVTWTSDVPRINYEVALDAMRVAGDDCFCALTFPVRNAYCTLIVGGEGGEVVGLSSVDAEELEENETMQFISFETGHWYRIRLRVTMPKIEAWIEQRKIVDVLIPGRKLAVAPDELQQSEPLGVAACQTTAALREIKIRHVTEPAEPGR